MIGMESAADQTDAADRRNTDTGREVGVGYASRFLERNERVHLLADILEDAPQRFRSRHIDHRWPLTDGFYFDADLHFGCMTLQFLQHNKEGRDVRGI